jgi:hypothetical protein
MSNIRDNKYETRNGADLRVSRAAKERVERMTVAAGVPIIVDADPVPTERNKQ